MNILYERLSKVQSSNPFFKKDLQKAINASKFIGNGSLMSSTHKYMYAAGDLANCGIYSSEDIVFVSAEGLRRGRFPVNYDELKKAIDAKVTFITDDLYNRERPYNLGEREVAKFLENNGYKDIGKGVWKTQI